MEKDYKLFGTKVLNLNNQEVGLLLYTWVNVYADKTVDFATCVDKIGRRYNVAMDDITPIEE